MPRRVRLITEAEVYRVFRAAKRAGAEQIEVRADGTIVVLMKALPPVEADNDNETKNEIEFMKWKREDEKKQLATRNAHRHEDTE